MYFSAKKQCKDDAILELFYCRDPGFSTIFISFCTKSPTSFHDPIPDVLEILGYLSINTKVAPSVSLMFLPHFDVLCDLLLNRRAATWNLFVLNNKELKYTEKKF